MGTGDGKAGGMETKRHLSKMTGIVIYLSIYLFILERKKIVQRENQGQRGSNYDRS